MIIDLYEPVFIKDGLPRAQGRKIGEVRFDGDGTTGKIIYNINCNKILEVRDENDYLYNRRPLILDELGRRMFERTLYESNYITTGGGFDGETHWTTGITLKPWRRETMENLIQYGFPVLGKFRHHVICRLFENVVNEDGSRSLGRIIGTFSFADENMEKYEINYYPTCNEIWEVRDVKHPCYKNKRVIFDESDKERFTRLLTEPFQITYEMKWTMRLDYKDGKTLLPGHYETYSYIMDTAIPESFDTIRGDFKGEFNNLISWEEQEKILGFPVPLFYRESDAIVTEEEKIRKKKESRIRSLLYHREVFERPDYLKEIDTEIAEIKSTLSEVDLLHMDLKINVKNIRTPVWKKIDMEDVGWERLSKHKF